MRKLNSLLLVTLLCSVAAGWSAPPPAPAADSNTPWQTIQRISRAWEQDGLWSVLGSAAAIESQSGAAVALIHANRPQGTPSAKPAAEINARRPSPDISARRNHRIDDTLRIPDLSPHLISLDVMQQLEESLERLSSAPAQIAAGQCHVIGASGAESRARSWNIPSRGNAPRPAGRMARPAASAPQPTSRSRGGAVASAPNSGSQAPAGTSMSASGRGHVQKPGSQRPNTTAGTVRPQFSAGSTRR